MKQDARGPSRLPIRVGANFAVEPLIAMVERRGAALGLAVTVEYAAPGHPEAPGTYRPATSARPGWDVLLVRLGDVAAVPALPPGVSPPPGSRTGPGDTADQRADSPEAGVVRLVRTVAEHCAEGVLLVLCPSPGPAPEDETGLVEAIRGVPGVRVVPSAEFRERHPEVPWDEPYREKAFAALAELVLHVVRTPAGATGPDSAVAPRTPVEAQVMDLWAGLLSPAPRSVHDNFFELSGDSLKLVQFLARVRGVFGVELPVTTLFQSTLSIAEIADAIELAQRTPGAGDPGEWEALVDDLAELSPDELEALLDGADDR